MRSVTIIYDGECPFCSNYARHVRLKSGVGGEARLIDARDADDPAVRDAKARGYNLDEGMVAVIDGQYYHGDAALHALALLSTRSDFFNRLNYRIFSSRLAARFFYPFLRAGRNAALCVKGVPKIHP